MAFKAVLKTLERGCLKMIWDGLLCIILCKTKNKRLIILMTYLSVKQIPTPFSDLSETAGSWERYLRSLVMKTSRLREE